MSNNGTKLKSTAPEKPVLRFTQIAWEKMWAITYGNKVGKKVYECSSIGIMDKDDPCLVEDVIVIKQKNTPSHTEMDDDELGNVTMALRKMGIAPSRMALWHHTHADFNTFWSSTDTDTIDRYAADGLQWAVVTSTKGGGEILVRCDMFKPFRTHFDDCDYKVIYPSIDVSDWTEKALAKMDNSYTQTRASGYSVGQNFSNRYGKMVNGRWVSNYGQQGSTTPKHTTQSKSDKKREAQINVLKAAQLAVTALDEAFLAGVFKRDECSILARRLLDGTIQASSLLDMVKKRLDKAVNAEDSKGVVVTAGARDETTVVVEPNDTSNTEICVSTVRKTSPSVAVLEDTATQQAGAIDG